MNADRVRLTIIPPVQAHWQYILSPQALDFIIALEDQFRHTRLNLLEKRNERQRLFDKGALPDFLPETIVIREDSWGIAPVPCDLQDRRVEITGPVERKMIINALNCDAKVFMADFEDSNSPTWHNDMQGQVNLYDAVRKSISFTDPKSNKKYVLKENTATLMVRPRGWHLNEAHVLLDGMPVSASIFDFGLFFFHNAKQLLEQGSGPYFYLPKLQSHLEARLWNAIFIHAQNLLGIEQGTIKATVLIETITAAFEMDEILYELKEHSAGLNCGRWDYIFSFIKKFRNHSGFVLPDRQEVTMSSHFLNAYVQLLIKTCHRRNAHAMGGMAAQIPIKHDDKANRLALEKVLADKQREVQAGHDGTWVAHPGLIPVALQAFNEGMSGANQIANKRNDVDITSHDLLTVPQGTITESSVRNNIRVGIQYLTAWLMGNGCVPINHLMEDAATAEICRAQLWQWLKFSQKLEGGQIVNKALFCNLVADEVQALMADQEGLTQTCMQKAKVLFIEMILNEEFNEFLTIPAYAQLLMDEEFKSWDDNSKSS